MATLIIQNYFLSLQWMVTSDFFENGKINDYFGSHIYDMLNFH